MSTRASVGATRAINARSSSIARLTPTSGSLCPSASCRRRFSARVRASSSAPRIATSSPSGVSGFSRNWNAPSLVARTASVRLALPLIMTTGTSGATRFSCSSVASPSGPPGIIRSSSTASGAPRSTAARAAVPFPASAVSKPRTAAAHPPSCGCWPRRPPAGCAGSRGQHDREGGTATRRLAGGDRAAVGLEGLPHERQPEARAVALGREIGLEHPLPHLLGDAGPVVGDGDRHATPVARHPHLDGAPAPHRLGGVAEQVAQRSTQRVVVALHGAPPPVGLDGDLHALGHRRAAQLLEQLHDVHFALRPFRETAEIRELPRQTLEAVGFGAQDFHGHRGPPSA